jgi:hypothetical protein
MKEIFMTTKISVFILLITISVGACASVVPPAEGAPTPVITDEPLPLPTQSEPQPEMPVSSAWRAVRDPRYGFGLAVPCWWLITPMPEEGFGGVMTIKNFDEAYFNANSIKGFWDWQNGTLKIDVISVEGVDPAKSDVDAYMQFVDPTMTGLVSAESQQIGANSVTVVTLSNLVNTNDPNTQVFIFRLAPAILLMVVPVPQSIINTPDFQALLGSVVLKPDDQVELPNITPSPALIPSSCAG